MQKFISLNNKDLPEHIHLALSEITLKGETDELLDEEEITLSQSITNAPRKEEYISTRLLVKRLAAELGYDPFSFKIKKNEFGKPYGQVDEDLIHLSIAHSNQLVLCGISKHSDVGIDLEPVDREVNSRLGSRMIHPDEDRQIRDLELIRLWTIKEALVKLQGGGLRTNLKDVKTTRTDETVFRAIFNNDKRAKICSFQYKDYWIAVAYYR